MGPRDQPAADPRASGRPGELSGTARLLELISGHPNLFVITGAGCSTDSGIPDYRDENGEWKCTPPVQLRDFMTSAHARRRYWSRSLVGWPAFSVARPSKCHYALTALQEAGYVHQLVTQNVDGLHTRAGTRAVIDLHGRNDRVLCVACGEAKSRDHFQGELVRRNPDFAGLTARAAPDGDADLDGVDFAAFEVPSCKKCGGVVRPDVVFFGDAVPRDRVQGAWRALCQADALFAVGTSLMVYSGFRFCREAAERKKPIVIVNRGKTRADSLATLKIEGSCASVLADLFARLPPRNSGCNRSV